MTVLSKAIAILLVPYCSPVLMLKCQVNWCYLLQAVDGLVFDYQVCIKCTAILGHGRD